MRKSTIALATILSASLMVVGCASEKSASTNGSSAGVASAKPVNQTCPFSGEPVDPSTAVSYKGQTVAFCCTNCEAKWNKMTDAQKDAKLAAAK